jgi:hypothetical protein
VYLFWGFVPIGRGKSVQSLKEFLKNAHSGRQNRTKVLKIWYETLRKRLQHLAGRLSLRPRL